MDSYNNAFICGDILGINIGSPQEFTKEIIKQHHSKKESPYHEEENQYENIANLRNGFSGKDNFFEIRGNRNDNFFDNHVYRED